MSNATDTKDPLVDQLVSEEGPDRAYYALGTLLDAQDFLDEQSYHRGRLARALAYLFGAGTVAGLKIGFKSGTKSDAGGSEVRDAELDEIFVEPGLAIDPFGRLVEVPRRACIRLKRWIDYQRAAERIGSLRAAVRSGRAIAWLFARFLPCERGKTPVIAQGPFDATNAVAPSRVRDGYELRLFLEGAPGLPAFPRAGADGLDVAAATKLAQPAGSPARIGELQDRILDGWGDPAGIRKREGSGSSAEREAARIERQGWVLLGRVDVPVTVTTDDVAYAVAPTNPPDLHNRHRPFVYGGWALALFADLPLACRSSGST